MKTVQKLRLLIAYSRTFLAHLEHNCVSCTLLEYLVVRNSN